MTGSRAEYLKAMGITQWRLRAVGADPGPQIDAGAADDAVAVPGAGQTPSADAAGGVAALDWESLCETVAACTRCALHQTRTQTVFGVGHRQADWMFVGEAPGGEEDRRGEPFVGRAGKLLDAMLEALGCRRDEVFIANVLKCRPPDNRDPHGEEVQQCGDYLLRQIDLVRPRLLIALGRFAAQSLLNTSRPIGKLRGEVFEHAASGTPLVVTYHPAYLLRNPIDKRKAWQDLCLIKQVSAAR